MGILCEKNYFGDRELVDENESRNTKAVCASEECEVYTIHSSSFTKFEKQFNILQKLKRET